MTQQDLLHSVMNKLFNVEILFFVKMLQCWTGLLGCYKNNAIQNCFLYLKTILKDAL